MAQLLNLSFQTSSSFLQCRALGSNGIFRAGTELPNGIPGRIWVEGSACHMYMNINDANTAEWKRTEIDFGEFPTATGEFWTSFEFKRLWTFKNYIVIGSWAVMINDVSGQTYVPIGFRVRDDHMIIQAPRDLNTIGFNNKELAAAPTLYDTWHKVVAHANLKADETGFIEIFFDGAPIYRIWNIPTTYSTATAHYFKLGPYDGNHDGQFTEAKMIIRNVATWSGNDGYNAVLGTAPKIPPRRLSY